jgi:hypothetical protein
VRAPLYNFTFCHHQDLMGVGDGGQTVGNNQRGAVFSQLI